VRTSKLEETVSVLSNATESNINMLIFSVSGTIYLDIITSAILKTENYLIHYILNSNDNSIVPLNFMFVTAKEMLTTTNT
jgi:hypothetical protein